MRAPADNQNYVNFRFKGGGAGSDQRTLRLDGVHPGRSTHFGFTVRVTGDLLDAIAGPDSRNTSPRKRLAMLGYLLAGTRMLDMRLATPSRRGRRLGYEAFLTNAPTAKGLGVL